MDAILFSSGLIGALACFAVYVVAKHSPGWEALVLKVARGLLWSIPVLIALFCLNPSSFAATSHRTLDHLARQVEYWAYRVVSPF